MFSLWYLSLMFHRSAHLSDKCILEKLENEYAKLQADENCKSLLKKHLTPELFQKLKLKVTPSRSTLYDIIMVGCLFPSCSDMGIIAPDPQAYIIFSELFYPIIEEYHENFVPSSRHPIRRFGDLDSFMDLDPCGEYVVATRIQCSRNLKEYTFVPKLSRCQFLEIEATLKNSFDNLSGDLKGKYYTMCDMTPEIEEHLRGEDALFSDNNPILEAAGVYKHWPEGRGVFQNHARNLAAFVNHEDHLLLMSSQEGGDIRSCYQRFQCAVSTIGHDLSMEKHENLGYLTVSPSNLGNALRAIVRVRLPRLSVKEEVLENLCQTHALIRHHLQDDVYDLFNKNTLGFSEFECVKGVQDGVSAVLQFEKMSQC